MIIYSVQPDEGNEGGMILKINSGGCFGIEVGMMTKIIRLVERYPIKRRVKFGNAFAVARYLTEFGDRDLMLVFGWSVADYECWTPLFKMTLDEGIRLFENGDLLAVVERQSVISSTKQYVSPKVAIGCGGDEINAENPGQ